MTELPPSMVSLKEPGFVGRICLSAIRGETVRYWGLFLVFLKVGAFTFGGGYAMIPLIRRELGERRKWLPLAELADILALSQSAPGAIAVNVAAFTGYKIAGLMGAAAAVLGAVLPSLVVILAIAAYFAGIEHLPAVTHLFLGLRPAVLSLILAAAVSVGRDVIHDWYSVAVVAVGVAAMFFLHLHPILVILLAGAAGALYRPTRRSRKAPAPAPDGQGGNEN